MVAAVCADQVDNECRQVLCRATLQRLLPRQPPTDRKGILGVSGSLGLVLPKALPLPQIFLLHTVLQLSSHCGTAFLETRCLFQEQNEKMSLRGSVPAIPGITVKPAETESEGTSFRSVV
jgi:hypothetical protein